MRNDYYYLAGFHKVFFTNNICVYIVLKRWGGGKRENDGGEGST
jgi:hypothetical protein